MAKHNGIVNASSAFFRVKTLATATVDLCFYAKENPATQSVLSELKLHK
jgi:hypothetical protein